MTSYSLEITAGYPSMVATDDVTVWIKEMRENPDWKAIKAIALRCGAPEIIDDDWVLDDFKEYIGEDGASGGGESRKIKEILQKAYVIWFLEEAAKRNMNINIIFMSE